MVEQMGKTESATECVLCGETAVPLVTVDNKPVCHDCKSIAWTGREKLDNIGTLYPFTNFVGCCRVGGFVNSDGFGRWATEDQQQCGTLADDVMPSKVRSGEQVPPPGFTHVMWYNR